MKTRNRIMRDKKLLTMLFSLLIYIFVISGSAHATNVSGTINTDTTWTLSGSPYVVSGASVSSGVTLTIEPGVVVKFSRDYAGLTINGTLTADGTLQQPIIFTSFKDDTYGGDTNGDGSGSSPAPGDWSRLNFSSTSTNNLLDNVIVRYGGYYTAYANVNTATSSLTISNSTIENSRLVGIDVISASPTITGNVIRDNSSYGIRLANSLGTTITGNSISGNGSYAIYLDSNSVNSTASISGNTITGNYRNGIYLLGGTLTTSATWVADAPYIVNGLTVSSGVTLTIEPGAVVKFTYGGLTINGTLTADGTLQQPIIFTSFKDDTYGGDTNGDGSGSSPALRDWRDLHFTSGSTNNLLDNVIVRYGGDAYYANVYTTTSSLTISNSTIENGLYGIRVLNASPTITGNVIRDNQSYGIHLTNSPGTTITGNSISGNGLYPIYLDSNSVNSTASISGNTITGNYRNGILISGATLTTSATWVADAPYIVNGLTVSSGVTLTIEPGAVVKFTYGGLTINGTLTADGTLQDPIIFTSFKDDTYGGDTNGDGSGSSPTRHDWRDLHFTSSSSNSLLDNVIVRYGGDAYYANVYTDTSSLTISNSTIENASYGIRVFNASPTITGNVIRDNSSYGIHLTNSPGTTITGNSISGNGYRGIYNATSSAIVIAKNNYWGDASGPYDPSDDRASGGWYNPTGTGDWVSDYVDYDPWLGSFPQCVDSDGDGYGVLENLLCLNGPQTDCDDSDPLAHPNQIWYMDIDSDGYSSGLFLIQCDRPIGAYKDLSELTDIGDCDDTDSGINPETYWYQDNDGDGFGTSTIYLQQCIKPEGSINYVLDKTDCDDNDASIYLGGPPVRVVDITTRSPQSYHWTLLDAYTTMVSGDVIQGKNEALTDTSLDLNQSKTVSLEGGYDCAYSVIEGDTSILVDVSISDGELKIESGVLTIGP